MNQALTVRDLADLYSAAFHGNLAVGRAIAGHAPSVAPLEEKWLLVESAYTLINLAAAWRTRLDELTVPITLNGSPAPEVTELANNMCHLDWKSALIEMHGYLDGWMRALNRFPTTGITHFQDALIVRDARSKLERLLGNFKSCGYETDGRDLHDYHFDRGPAVESPTGTPKLEVRFVPKRAYPPQSKLTEDEFRINPDAGTDQIFASSLHNGLQIEFISIDIPLLNAAEFEQMPLEFYVDMSRHAHDEMRHSIMIEENLQRYDAAIGDFPFTVPDRYELMAENDLQYRLVILSRTGESEAIEALSDMIPQLDEMGEVELARMWGYVLSDEVRHTHFGNKWLRYLVGDDDEAVDAVTRQSIERYNMAIEEGRLSKPPRPLDYLNSPGPPIETVLRDLAGFSFGEIETLTACRGSRESETSP